MRIENAEKFINLLPQSSRDWTETVPESGWLKPWQEDIIASETSGLRVTEILADVGSVVKKGQTLVLMSQ
ncbi:hypothetical protein ACC733_38935, partial [Rhizobium johnstonii]